MSSNAIASCVSIPTINLSVPNITISGPRDNVTYPVIRGNWSTAQGANILSDSCGWYMYSNWVVSSNARTGMTISTSTPYTGVKTFDIYATGITNIGYIAIEGAGVTSSPSNPLKDTMTLNWQGTVASMGESLSFAFVQTGPLESGSYNIPGQLIANHYGSRNSSSNDMSAGPAPFYYTTTKITVNSKTCTIDAGSANQTVTLPDISTSVLTSPGATGGNTMFYVTLNNCDPSIKLYATLTDANDTSSTEFLTNTGTATGVNTRILLGSNQTPLPLGPQSSVKGNPGQFYINTGQTSYAVPFMAQYLQTGSTATAGSVNSLLWVTFSYQ